MDAHVLLNLLDESGKRDKMRGLSSIVSLFRNEFDKFNYTRGRILDSIYHMKGGGVYVRFKTSLQWRFISFKIKPAPCLKSTLLKMHVFV